MPYRSRGEFMLCPRSSPLLMSALINCGEWPVYSFGPPEGDGRKMGTQSQAIGRSRAALTTKIVALLDAFGNLVRCVLLPGQTHDRKGVTPLMRGVSFGALQADKAFDANWLLE